MIIHTLYIFSGVHQATQVLRTALIFRGAHQAKASSSQAHQATQVPDYSQAHQATQVSDY